MLVRLGPLPPRPTADRRWSVVLRGRVVNEATLRKELSARDHPARPETAEEIARALVAEMGPVAAAGRLAGDWWFVASDAHTGDRWLIRDALGLGEVAWAAKDGELLLGSPADVAAAAGLRSVSRDALAWWLAAGAVPAPLTWWEGVSALPAGHALRLGGSAPESTAWHRPPPSVGGWGSRNDLRRWAAGLRGSFQVAALQRLEGADAVATCGDLDETVLAIDRQRGRNAVPAVTEGGPTSLDAVCARGPVPAEVAALWPTLLRAREEGHRRVVVSAGAAAIAGWREGRLRDAVAGWIGRREQRAGVFHEPPSTLPAAWTEALESSRGGGPHAWERLVGVRGALAPGLAQVAESAGIEVSAPWISPAVEALCAAVPAGLRSPPGRPGALVRAAFPEVHAPVRHPAIPIDGDAVADVLDGWVDARAVRDAFAGAPGSGDPRAWRLAAAAAWRRGGTVS
jgi:hypothetical protein